MTTEPRTVLEAAWPHTFGNRESDTIRTVLDRLGIDPDMPFEQFRRRWMPDINPNSSLLISDNLVEDDVQENDA